jgi:TPR repeat protein
MAGNRQIIEKNIDQLLHLTVAPTDDDVTVADITDDWHEAMGGGCLNKNDRGTFNHAFNSFVAGSYDSAFRGFAKLSTRGSFVSQYHLGLLYLKGMGTLQDYCYAHLWFNIASSQGHNKARIQLEKITNKMCPQQIANAQLMARAWAAKKN